MRNLFLAICFLLGASAGVLSAQDKYFTKDGKIFFHSDAKLEKIEAVNNKVSSVLEIATGKMEFSVLMKGFAFEKALMQEHFNENYVESDKFPKTVFKGAIADLKSVNFAKDGSYNVTVSGQMTMHGVTKPVSAAGTVEVKGGTIVAKSKFKLPLADYGITIPSVVADNISKEVEISVNMDYKPFTK